MIFREHLLTALVRINPDIPPAALEQADYIGIADELKAAAVELVLRQAEELSNAWSA